MRLAGPNVLPPADRAGAVALLREAVDSGVDHIDTAENYGPAVVNELIREALSPYPPDLVLVSKVGAERGKRGEIFAYDRPDQLRRGIEDNLKTLGMDSIGAVNLRLMRASAPNALFDDQLAVMTAARDDGLIGGVGLSNVSHAQLQHALEFVEVACVQNAFHPADRSSEPVLEECLAEASRSSPSHLLDSVLLPCWPIRRWRASRAASAALPPRRVSRGS